MKEQQPFDVVFDQTRGLQTTVSNDLSESSHEDLRIRADSKEPWFLRGHGDDDHDHDHDHDHEDHRTDKDKDKDEGKDKGKPGTPPPKKPPR
ncbi:MAG: hypothetical protein M3041_21225 [Acidobacteriota bacterium]|nr:hypothetical protein [Acidobacteriota bacterium]